MRQPPLNFFSRRAGFGRAVSEVALIKENSPISMLRRGDNGLDPVAGAAIFENRNVTAFAQHDPDAVFAAFGPIIFLQLVAQAAGFHADNRVNPRVKRLPPVEHLQSDEILLEPVRLAQETFFDHKLQETADAMRLYECAATKNQIQLRANLGGGNTV